MTPPPSEPSGNLSSSLSSLPVPSTASRPGLADVSGFGFLYLAWVVALGASLGSLFFSEVMKLPPCTLCWYQRICLYPLVLMLPTGIVLRDARVTTYAMPLVIAGLAIAAYHNLLYYGVIAEALSPCTAGVPCTSRQINWFGFVGIPLLGLLAFVSLLLLLILHQTSERRRRKDPA
ncbi:MAG TPA: disulfide oxidoreductase [Polyangia bacterium]